MPLPSLDETQTSELLAVLSLDLARPFLDDMGLPMAERAAAFQQVLREAFAQLREQVQRSPEKTPDVAGQVVHALTQAGLERLASALWSWAPQAFLGHHASQPMLSGWGMAVHRWAWPPRQIVLPVAMGPTATLVEAMAARYRQRLESMDLEPRLKSTRDQALSDWDMSMFARHGWAETEYAHPVEAIESIATMHAAIDAWRQVAAKAPPDLQQSLAAHADATLKSVSARMPRALPPLGRLIGDG